MIAALGTVLTLLATTAGTYFVVMHVDRSTVQRDDVKNGYALFVGKCMWATQAFTLYLASLPLSAYVISGVLIAIQKVVLKVGVPVLKRCFGDDDRKLWSFLVPAAVLALGSSDLACFSWAQTWPRSSSGCFWCFKKPTRS